MKHLMFLATLVLAVAGHAFVVAPAAAAGQSCQTGHYFDTVSLACVKKVQLTIRAQDRAAASGPRWGLVNSRNCAQASREMDRSAAKCRRMDAQRGVYDAALGRIIDGKMLEQCARCCRQLREGMNRWRVCHANGYAPPPDYRTARRSAERMNCSFTY